MNPLIPLNRVVPDPNARFQRFGPNDSQLIGKPVNLAPAPPVQKPPVKPRADESPLADLQEKPLEKKEVYSSRENPAPAMDFSYSPKGGASTSRAPSPGALVNLKA